MEKDISHGKIWDSRGIFPFLTFIRGVWVNETFISGDNAHAHPEPGKNQKTLQRKHLKQIPCHFH
ncbi:MAG TPA: hypothetical protein VK469_07540 [Candidatus Kapabacteria bacterium]|nr:hypothetical protein [Candidatus Kapabacteria bacterium]